MGKNTFMLFISPYFLILSLFFPISSHAENIEERLSVTVDSEGRVSFDPTSETITTSLQKMSSGDTLTLSLKFSTTDQSSETSTIGVYLKAHSENFDPEEQEYAYDFWVGKTWALSEEMSNINCEMDPERYNELEKEYDFYFSQYHKNTFGKTEYSEEEKALLKAIRHLNILIDDSDTASLNECGLLKITELNNTEVKNISVVIDIPDDMTRDELSMIRGCYWDISIKELGKNPSASISAEMINQPVNGHFFVPATITADGLISPSDSAVGYHIIIENNGDIPWKLYQLRIGENTYFTGKNLVPGETREIEGWISVSNEMAEKGENELNSVLEVLPDQPEFTEHLKVSDSFTFNASYEDVSNQSKASNREKRFIIFFCLATILFLIGLGAIAWLRRKNDKKILY